jgi:hypothetical protein
MDGSEGVSGADRAGVRLVGFGGLAFAGVQPPPSRRGRLYSPWVEPNGKNSIKEARRRGGKPHVGVLMLQILVSSRFSLRDCAARYQQKAGKNPLFYLRSDFARELITHYFKHKII